MKICIPTSDDRGTDSETSSHFGRSPFFAMVDTDTGAIDIVRNPGCHESHHSCDHSRVMKAYAVEAVVCSGVGRRALESLHQAGVEVMVSNRPTVSDVLESVASRPMHPMKIENACGGSGHRHQHGTGCRH